VANNPGTDQPRTGIVCDILKGAALTVIGLAAVAIMDAVTKHLATRWNVPLIGVPRHLGHGLVLASIHGPMHGRWLFRLRLPGFRPHVALSRPDECLPAALSRTPVGETVSIVYLAPAIVTSLAIFFLREWVTCWGSSAVLPRLLAVGLLHQPEKVAIRLVSVISGQNSSRGVPWPGDAEGGWRG
jgi:hypothetical protein